MNITRMIATAEAPSNLALLKYWGKTDEQLRLPANGSISMNLSNLVTKTTVSFSPSYTQDSVCIDGRYDASERVRVIAHLDRIRRLARISSHAHVFSTNSFPCGTGLSSSASGFAALTLAGCRAAGLSLAERELSVLARQASGSACRSIPSGFVEWKAGETSDASYAFSLHPPSWWDICDVVAVVHTEKKSVPTSAGQSLAHTSPFFALRVSRMEKKLALLRLLLARRDFPAFGAFVEQEAFELHAIMLTSTPPLLYISPQTVSLLSAVSRWRAGGLPVFVSLNTGQDVHLLCEDRHRRDVEKRLRTLRWVRQIISNHPCVGARLIQTEDREVSSK